MPGRKSERAAHSRRKNGGWELFNAEAAYAEGIFRSALGQFGAAVSSLEQALEVKPDYAPAIFMGTVEYQRARRAEGRKLFESLLSLPEDTTELCEIIDKAGDFLIQRGAYKDRLGLYRAAAARFPRVAVFHQGGVLCGLEPSNQKFVNDLG